MPQLRPPLLAVLLVALASCAGGPESAPTLSAPRAAASADAAVSADPNSLIVGRVDLLGLHTSSEAELRSLLRTRAGVPYDPDLFEADVQAVLGYLYDRGMLEATVKPDGVRTRGQIDLSLRIDEGVVYRVGTIAFGGDVVGTEDEMRRRLRTRSGQVLSRSVVRGDLEELRRLGRGKGIEVELEPRLTLSRATATADLVLWGTRR